MAHKSAGSIIAFIVLILLYALVPISLFFLAVGSIFDVLYLIKYLETRNLVYGVSFIVLTLALLFAFYFALKLVSWLKR